MNCLEQGLAPSFGERIEACDGAGCWDQCVDAVRMEVATHVTVASGDLIVPDRLQPQVACIESFFAWSAACTICPLRLGDNSPLFDAVSLRRLRRLRAAPPCRSGRASLPPSTRASACACVRGHYHGHGPRLLRTDTPTPLWTPARGTKRGAGRRRTGRWPLARGSHTRCVLPARTRWEFHCARRTGCRVVA